MGGPREFDEIPAEWRARMAPVQTGNEWTVRSALARLNRFASAIDVAAEADESIDDVAPMLARLADDGVISRRAGPIFTLYGSGKATEATND